MRRVLACAALAAMSCSSTGEHSGAANPAMGADSQEGSRSAAGSQAVAGMSPDAAGSASGPQGDDGGDRLISVNVNVNGAERTVESSGMMVLQDLQGELRYTITADQYATIAARVRSPEFAAAMDDPQDCHMITDGGLQRVTVQWTDIGMQIDSAAASCFDPPEQSNHIYTVLHILSVTP
jgi:hypothetical protein